MEKRIRIANFNQRVTWPNLYVMLVGKPGSGKTTAIGEVYSLLSSAGMKLAPKSTTAASLYDALAGSIQTITVPGRGILTYSALACLVDELAVWMPQYDNQLSGFLSEIWDGKAQYSETRRTREVKPIEHPIMNLLVGVQPAYLAGILPRMAHDQGLLTRCLIIYSYERVAYDLTWDDIANDNTAKFASLIAGLKRIKMLVGDMVISPEARAILNDFHKNNKGLEDEKFENYNNRRILTVTKLAMCASASMGNDLVISPRHVAWGIDTLTHAEVFMPEAYREMGKPESAQIMSEIFAWARAHYRKTGKPIPEHRLLQAIHSKAPVTMIQYIWKQMIEQRYFKSAPALEKPGNLWLPVMDSDRD